MWTRRFVPLAAVNPEAYTFVAVLRMEWMLRCCKALINPSSNLQRCRLSRHNNVGQIGLANIRDMPDGFEARKISLGAAVFSGFCKFCVSSCSLAN